MTSLLRLGVIGCGRAARDLHLPALRGAANLAVSSLCDTNEEALAQAAAIAGVQRGYTAYRDLVADRTVDAVGICVPPDEHLPAAVAALEAGKPVYLEKPLALTVAECDQLVECANDAKIVIQVGFNLRHHRLVRGLRQTVAASAADGFQSIRSVYSAPTRLRGPVPAWRDRMDRGDDVLFEIAVHHFDLWRHILDTEVEEIFSMIDTRGGIGTTVTVSARLANGALASAVFADASAPRNEIELLGPAGRVRADLYRFDGFETTPTAVNGGEITWRGRQVLNSFAALPKALRSLRLGGENLASYRHSWETFAQAVSDNANYGATVFDGRMATAIADAAGLSAQRNQPVPVSP